jgi:hypothetical protein
MEVTSMGAHVLRFIATYTPVRTHVGRMAQPVFSARELARIRKSLDLTIQEVAHLASLTPCQIKYMEEDSADVRYRPGLEILESVSAALHFHIMRRLKRREGVAPERRRKA